MNAKYDDTTIRITPRFRKALEELLAAECEMMAKNDPTHADCWTWGRCEIQDLSSERGLCFTFGGDEDKPEGKRFAVTVANTEVRHTGPGTGVENKETDRRPGVDLD